MSADRVRWEHIQRVYEVGTQRFGNGTSAQAAPADLAEDSCQARAKAVKDTRRTKNKDLMPKKLIPKKLQPGKIHEDTLSVRGGINQRVR